MAASTSVIKSYVYHKDKCFYVSTIERDSSAVEAHGLRYNETIVCELDDEACRGPFIYQLDGLKGSIKVHQRAVQDLYDNGVIDTDKY